MTVKFTKDHEWIKIEDNHVAVIGITEYAQHALGDLVFIELPKMGAVFSKGANFAVVESVKTAAEVYTPVTGEVVAVNNALENDFDLLKSESDGWIAKFRMTDAAELEGLMDESAYQDYLKTVE
ncbi:MAG: glycine cleavage system protein GcvH [Alphaproteobacteria bacterium]|nr:glycine cleavage system protein GcvH [Alphaproteobacteria bacterium]MCB9984292.1 glycine cleavage system protein GcvH [Micavibrio sp.]HPQ50439.1 glycine cleavage system protein GcvH [Alphaproteobacteria bacterium]